MNDTALQSMPELSPCGWALIQDGAMTPVLSALTTALCDVDNLIEHHPAVVDPGQRRPDTDEGPLLRSCVLLAYAAWEMYVENGLIWAVEELVGRSSSPDQLPGALRAFVADVVRSDPWRLAGDAWREATVDAVKARVRGTGGDGSFGLNTAGPRQVIALHDQVLGARLLDECRWQGKPTSKIKNDLALLISVRGTIAHTGQAPGSLNLAGARSWRDWVQRLAEQLDRQLESWVENHLTGNVQPD